jgi:hypothetical protein
MIQFGKFIEKKGQILEVAATVAANLSKAYFISSIMIHRTSSCPLCERQVFFARSGEAAGKAGSMFLLFTNDYSPHLCRSNGYRCNRRNISNRRKM